jgi:hypothetical protein
LPSPSPSPAAKSYYAANTVDFITLRQTYSVRQCDEMTRTFDYAALCQGCIMTFGTTMRHYGIMSLCRAALCHVAFHHPTVKCPHSNGTTMFAQHKF